MVGRVHPTENLGLVASLKVARIPERKGGKGAMNQVDSSNIDDDITDINEMRLPLRTTGTGFNLWEAVSAIGIVVGGLFFMGFTILAG